MKCGMQLAQYANSLKNYIQDVNKFSYDDIFTNLILYSY